MFFRERYSLVLLFIFFCTGAYADTGQTLTLQEAETLALATDPGSRRFQSLAMSMQENSVAVRQLPDPKLNFGMMNFPTDTFNRDQEPMTQIQLGVQQMFPRGDSLKIKSKKSVIMAQAHGHRAQNRQRMILKKVRQKWLELYYWNQAEDLVRKNRKSFEQLVEVAQLHYASGRRNQQDVILAHVELSRLDDRVLDIKTRQEKVRAELAVLIGKKSDSINLPESLPILNTKSNIDEIESDLANHPKVLIAKAQVESGKQDVALAREGYKPGWGLGVKYGVRDGQNPNGSDRPDFLSVGVTMDLPLFKEKRQDRKLKASQHKLGANREVLDQQFLDLRQILRKDFADWLRLDERVDFYKDTLIPQVRQNTEAALFAYQNDRADFSTVMKARITELNTQLKSIRMHVDRSKAEARLLYISGEE